jgi:hypothetical protein
MDDAIHDSACPCCGSSLRRSHRRLVDRLVSLVVAVRRYRCVVCGWRGTLRIQRVGTVRRPDCEPTMGHWLED